MFHCKFIISDFADDLSYEGWAFQNRRCFHPINFTAPALVLKGAFS